MQRYVFSLCPLFVFACLLVAYPGAASYGSNNEIDLNKARLYVLSIGVSKYKDANLNLRYAHKDAQDMAEAFRQQTHLYDVQRVQVLVDEQATRKGIREALTAMRALVRPSDLFVFIFSGHGLEDRLVPYDFSHQDPFSTSLLKDDLRGLLDGLGCNYVILVDACHSGSMAKGISKSISISDVSADSRRLYEGLKSHDKTQMIIGSSASNQLSFECAECTNGYFAAVVRDAFANRPVRDSDGRTYKPDQNGDGIVTLNEFSEYIQDGVRIKTAEARKKDSRIDVQKVYARVQSSANLPFIRVSGSGTAPPPSPRREDPPPPRYPDPIQQLIDNMVLVQGGTFDMGCTREYGSECKDFERPPRRNVMVSDYRIGRYEVTQAQWRAVMGADPPGLYNTGCNECPVESVTWVDVQEFIRRLNELTRMDFRLPTEAEWEYAARGGRQSRGFKYSGSYIIKEVAWYDGNYKKGKTQGTRKTTHPVGQLKANELGLYDMSGNVWEWCEDDWHDNYESAPPNGRAWIDHPRAGSRIFRGGSWDDNPQSCRVSNRNGAGVKFRRGSVGFRLASSP
jgi:formylglycine-generating enzyme required for sulfatase activity/uncharacterized caspase-like protein